MVRRNPSRSVAHTSAILAAVFVALCLWADLEALHVSLGDGGDGLEFLSPTLLGSPLSWAVLFYLPLPDYDGQMWRYETVLWAGVTLPQLINAGLLLWAPLRYLRRRPARRPGDPGTAR